MIRTASARAKAIGAELQHPPAAAIAAELFRVRERTRLLFLRCGPSAFRAQQVLRLEARQRYLRGLLRDAMGEAEPVSPGGGAVVRLRTNYGL